MDRNPQQFDTAPAEAFRFLVPAAPAAIAAAGDEQAKRRRFDGVAYSGDVISGHWFWGAVIFDLASTRVAERVPALIDHDRAQRAGWAALTIAADRITASGELLDNEQGRAVAADSDAGFPWQMSVHIEPGRIEEVQPGARVAVNGREVVGPAVIFRDSQIREVSFTPTGADPNTSARAFTRTAGQFARHPSEDSAMPDQHAERIAALETQLAAISAERDAANAERDAAVAQLAQFSAQQRRAEVERLFADTGREFSDAAAAPFMGMDATQFAAAAQFAREAASAAPNRDDLQTERATGGNAEGEQSPAAIAQRARKFHAEQHAAGNRISFHAAVAAVTN